MHPIWGPMGELYRGWAADEAIRFRAAAGGMLTALGVHLSGAARSTRCSM